MTQATALLALAGLLLTALGALSFRLPTVLRALVLAQVVYWSLAYVFRPIVLLLVKPNARLGDALVDPRLSFDNYTRTIASVMAIVCLGLVAYLISTFVLATATRGSAHRSPVPPTAEQSAVLLRTLLLAFLIGWTGRLATLLGLQNAATSLVALVCSAGAVGLILKIGRSRRSSFLIVSVVCVSELLWSVAIASKTPILGAILAIAIRLIAGEKSRIRLVPVLALALSGAVVFTLIQRLKVSASTAREIASADSTYPMAVQPLLPILRRFDLLNATTDAYLVGPGGWLNLKQFVATAIEVVTPGIFQSGEKISLGRAWASQVRAESLANSNTDVSLAIGPIAEGWATGGVIGVVVQAFALSLVLVLTYRCLISYSPTIFTFGCTLLAVPVAFERGILGNLALITQAAQAAGIVFVLVFIARGTTKREKSRVTNRQMSTADAAAAH